MNRDGGVHRGVRSGESVSSWVKALLCMLKYMPVFFFSSFYIVYIILNAVLKQYQIAGCRFFLLSLSLSILRVYPAYYYTPNLSYRAT